MNKTCIHPNCRPLTPTYKNGLCKYHNDEFEGKSEWTCSFCEKLQEERRIDTEEMIIDRWRDA